MNKIGRQEVNKILTYDVFKTSLCKWHGYAIYRDSYPNKELLVVDTAVGRVGRMRADGSIFWYNAKDSKKKNGYLYIPVYTDIKKIVVGVHTIVAVARNSNILRDQIEQGKNLVVNHMNNVPWDNSPENTEWVTVRANNLHGKMVHAIHRFTTGMTIPVYNDSKTEFISLINGISASEVTQWANLVHRVIKQQDQFNEDDVRSFLSYLGSSK